MQVIITFIEDKPIPSNHAEDFRRPAETTRLNYIISDLIILYLTSLSSYKAYFTHVLRFITRGFYVLPNDLCATVISAALDSEAQLQPKKMVHNFEFKVVNCKLLVFLSRC